jgi:hypothetical protein
MYAFLRALLDSLLAWVTGAVKDNNKATDATEDRELQTRIGKRVSDHIRLRRSKPDTYGGLHSYDFGDRGRADADRSTDRRSDVHDGWEG